MQTKVATSQLEVHGVPAEEVAEQVNDDFCLLWVVLFSIMPFATWSQTGVSCSFHAMRGIIVRLSECVCGLLLYHYHLPVYMSTRAKHLTQSTLLVETWATKPSAPSLF